MQPREHELAAPPADADAARARLARDLRRRGRNLNRRVAEAFAEVPRHVFVPEVGPAAAYRDEAFVIKCGPDGIPVSSSSQPAMMAIMLDQLGLEPGHRVLEIGTGSGYNAAVMSAVVGTQGQVVSIDIDPELVERSRASLASAGYEHVTLLCADGGFGDPAGAPFDRIIVTAGAWDIAPAWLEQLTPGGILVLPLSIRGIQLSVALQRCADPRALRPRDPPETANSREPDAGDVDEWLGISAWRCGFVRMLGAFAGPERAFRLDEPNGLVAQMADGRPVDGPALQRALGLPPSGEEPLPPPGGQADLADLDLWLTMTAPRLDRVTVLAAPGGWLPIGSLLPFGGLVSNAADAGRIGVALLLPADLSPDQQAVRAASESAVSGALVRGFGPGGAELVAHLADLAARWIELGRPAAQDLRIVVRPAHAKRSAAPSPGTLLLHRPSISVEAGWPAR
jgi:protein-L-isoaspartate(D-aspartate) O-methyltransferase